jgi:hypothetical protein
MGEQAVVKLIARIEGDQGASASIVLPNRLIPRAEWDEQRIRRSAKVDASAAID